MLLSTALLFDAAAWAAPAAPVAPVAPVATVEVQRQDGAVRVLASARLKADLRSAWDTLVGYERLPEFVPDMRLSRTLQRTGDEALVQQSGRAGFGPIQKDFSLTLRVTEAPMQSVFAHAVAGDFVRFESRYRLRAAEGGITVLDYEALIEPRDGIPPLVGVPVMRWAIQRQFAALLAEIERRSAQGAAGG